jgi:hypothetical protein
MKPYIDIPTKVLYWIIGITAILSALFALLIENVINY